MHGVTSTRIQELLFAGGRSTVYRAIDRAAASFPEVAVAP
jgi:hypothetical protein